MPRRFIITTLAATLIAGVAQAQIATDSAAYAAAAKPGDDQLTCGQIKAEGTMAQAQTMTLAQQSGTLTPEQEAKARATAAAGAGAGLGLGLAGAAASLIPGVGMVASAAINGAAQQGVALAGKATQAKMMADANAEFAKQEQAFSTSSDRMMYLMALYREKCL